jgi:dehydrogenase/reductase SDR family protein X
MQWLWKLWYKLYLNLVGVAYVVKEQILDRHRKPSIPVDTSGTNIVITGGSRGIGLEAVKKLLALKCRVIVGCRSVDQAAEALNAKEHKDQLTILPLDLMKLSSVRAFAEQVKSTGIPIHCLINNAGIMFGPRRETEDGFECQLATNHIGHFLLTHLLFGRLEASGSVESPARVVNVSSIAHYLGSWMDFQDLHSKKMYSPEQAYGNSKAAQVMFSQYLDSMQASKVPRVRILALHPGVVKTDLYTHVWWVKMFDIFARCTMKSAEQGGDTLVHAALAPDLATSDINKKYLENSRLAKVSAFTGSLENQKKLWEATCQLLHIQEFGKE